MEVGDYTVTWGAVTGYTTPAQATQTLAGGGSLLFEGGYTAQTGDIAVDANPDAIDAPWHLEGPGGWTYDGNGDLHDIKPQDCELAGMACKNNTTGY